VAEEVQIAGTPATAKIRSPWAAALLPIITLGIYALVWYYKINREMADLGRARGKTDELGDSPGKSLLAITVGALIIVPAVISIFNTGKRIQAAQRLTGIEPQMNGWLAIIMGLLISPVLYAYEQSELNKVWRSTGAPPAVEPGEVTATDLGPGATTPSQAGPETTEFR
jgi:Zn-dependent protease with chaperone function